MKVLIIHSSPNQEGLTAACANAALEGVKEARGEAEIVRLNDLKIERCRACDNGWGICRSEHRCIIEDDFANLKARFDSADAFMLVTPVYYGDLSESMKAFTDRLRRCEATRADQSSAKGKFAIFVAAAGGGGGGAVNCLLSLDRWLQHLRAERFDTIAITRRTRAYKLDTIRQAAKAMAQSG